MVISLLTRREIALSTGFGMVSLLRPDSLRSSVLGPEAGVLDVGLFRDIRRRQIPEGVVKLRTSGYASPGVGAAFYVRSIAGRATPYRTRSKDGAWWELAESRIRPEMLGVEAQAEPVPDGDDIHSASQPFQVGQVVVPPGGSISERRFLSLAGKGDSGLRLDGGSIQISNLVLQGKGALDQGLGVFSNAVAMEGIHVRSLALDTAQSSGLGHGVNIQNGVSFFTIRDLYIKARGYGLLTYTAAGVVGIENMRIMDFTVLGGSDAIEFNTPENPQRNTVVWGGHLQASYAKGAEAGFSFGLAHCEGFVAGGFLSIGSTNEGLHIEDGSSMGVAAAFVLRDTGKEGVRHYRSGRHAAEATPIVFSGFAANKNPTAQAENSSGFYVVNAPGGVQGRSPIVAGYLRGYETGLRLDGAALFSVGYVAVDGAKNVISLSPGGRALSATLFSSGAQVLVEARGGGAEVGAVHQEVGAPAALILSSRSGSPPSCLSEFSCPAMQMLPFSFTKAGYSWLDLFSAPALMFGRLKVRLEAGGWIYWSGTVRYDGREVAVENTLNKAVGPQAVGAAASNVLRIHQGRVQISIYSDKEAKLRSLWVHFQGEYLA